MVSKDLLKGTLKTIVLKLLEENGRMYGYEITQGHRDNTDRNQHRPPADALEELGKGTNDSTDEPGDGDSQHIRHMGGAL